MIIKELHNRAETLYHAKEDPYKYISYGYVSNQIIKPKTKRLIDNFQSGLMDKDIDEKDLNDILRINDHFKEFALEKPENRITSKDLPDVCYFLNIIQKYK
jgi:hypothetical protein|tara:strand:- start:365 stop:667 length:303 start_codon:yes stop_codon:yes gene_type:complete